MRKHYKHVSSFLNKQEADFLFYKLSKEIPWRQVKYFKPDRGYVITPRETWVCGYHETQYKKFLLGNEVVTPNAIPEFLKELKSIVEDYLQESYNFLLLSHYRDENDSIAFHSDDEKFLGYNPNIASITVGQPRPFLLKQKTTRQRESFVLNHGDLFVMKNNCQTDYLHSVPKQKEPLSSRFSITFRKALNQSATKNYYTYN